MLTDNKIYAAHSEGKDLFLLPKMANRHGLIAGATGTGKTITMKVLAESFSDMGVPVFLADIKGDLSGMCEIGQDNQNVRERVEAFGIENWSYANYPTRFWDIFGLKGHPVRVTVSDLGPTLLSHLLGLTDVQAGVLNIVFKVADDNGLLLIDLKDIRAMLQFVGDNRKEYTTVYGNVSTASIGAIQRALLSFEEEGGTDVFGEPALDIRDWIRTDSDGRGFINILSGANLVNSPTTYGTFLLWMLSELFEKLPEVGDLDKPRLVFFFDEAHLLFSAAKKTLLQKIVQVVKLIRSKGVGVYFISQSPSDIPNDVLAQLSNRVQHALRAYTPMEQTAVKAAAKAFRANASFDTEAALMELGVGEALVSFLDENGVPSVVERAKILPPRSLMGSASDEAVTRAINASEFELKYRESFDRESAYEIIMQANQQLQEEQQRLEEEAQAQKLAEKEALAAQKEAERQELLAQKEAARQEALAEKEAQKRLKEIEKEEAKSAKEMSSAFAKTAQKATKSATSSIARSLSTNLVNSVAGGKKVSTGTMAKRAATNALSSVMRTGADSILRGLFGNKK